jgi:hypothetical protein
MAASCPTCNKSEFSYRALRSVHPYPGEFGPASIACPSCGSDVRVTAKSRLVAAILMFVFATAPSLLMLWAGLHLHTWQIVIVAMGGIAIYYYAIWPLVVRLKPWSEFQYWLPKSRLIGYSVYLFLPVATIVLLVYLAAKFELGM